MAAPTSRCFRPGAKSGRIPCHTAIAIATASVTGIPAAIRMRRHASSATRTDRIIDSASRRPSGPIRRIANVHLFRVLADVFHILWQELTLLYQFLEPRVYTFPVGVAVLV